MINRRHLLATTAAAALPLPALGQRVKGSLGVGTTYVGPRALPYGERSDAQHHANDR